MKKPAGQTSSPRRVVKIKPRVRPLAPDQRYDANIDHILRAAASVFAEKSFGLASIRDIAAHARISFPRIYYYLRNKEELLYLISRRAFEELLKRGEDASRASDPATRLRKFIEGHLGYHMDNLAEMKVLVREADSLSGRYPADIARLKRDYSRICRRIIEQYAEDRGRTLDRERSRIVTSLLFGSMNWFYTWYEPTRDYEQRARIMDEVFRMVSGSIAGQ